MKVHPAADVFPMMPDDDLRELAADIKANGLIHPIITADVADEDGEVHEKLVDGRNRLAACKLAGVEPKFSKLNGQDPAAFILSANINRRHMSAGQRAMAVAMIYPDAAKTKRKGSGSLETKELGLSAARISQARTVLRQARDLATAVMSGAVPLDRAYDHARKLAGTAHDENRRLAELRKSRSDLADKVEEGDVTLDEAEARARQDAEQLKQQRYDATMNLIDGGRFLDRPPEDAASVRVMYDPTVAASIGEQMTPARLRRIGEFALALAVEMESLS